METKKLIEQLREVAAHCHGPDAEMLLEAANRLEALEKDHKRGVDNSPDPHTELWWHVW